MDRNIARSTRLGDLYEDVKATLKLRSPRDLNLGHDHAETQIQRHLARAVTQMLSRLEPSAQGLADYLRPRRATL